MFVCVVSLGVLRCIACVCVDSLGAWALLRCVGLAHV